MICVVVGARPNFIKMAPVLQALALRGMPHMLVHTGQHYDEKMSAIFFEQLQMPAPDVYLGVGSGSHAVQTARIMIEFEQVCLANQFDLVMVAGDVNSTLACALVASKLMIPIAHVEAGLRSFDRTMPEETNRMVTDCVSDLLFTTEPDANENLASAGIDSSKIHYVGNTMIDSLDKYLPQALACKPWEYYGLTSGEYGLVTLHRPANVDDPQVMDVILAALDEIGARMPLLFPLHPRTASRNSKALSRRKNIYLVEPLGYLDFLGLMARAKIVITDSGGIQEETTALQIPCVTIRPNTERPITLTKGTNRLVQPVTQEIVNAVLESDFPGENSRPELWDGHAAQRIVHIIEMWLDRNAAEYEERSRMPNGLSK